MRKETKGGGETGYHRGLLLLVLASIPVLLASLASGCWYNSHTDIAGPDVTTDTRVDTGADGPPLLLCPEDMVSVQGVVCMDRYEASRPDASATSEGEDTGPASSVFGVMPWRTSSGADGYALAQEACREAGKRLCSAHEWLLACAGPEGRRYCYGDVYEPTTCNGIDAYCPDPYPFCGMELGGFHLDSTGSFSGCVSPEGIHDINGNLWEWIEGAAHEVKGGAYNCGDSATLHSCTYTSPAIYRSAVGFRCCLVP